MSERPDGRERRAKYGCVGAIVSPVVALQLHGVTYHQNPRQRRRARTVSRRLHTCGNRVPDRRVRLRASPPPAVTPSDTRMEQLRRLRARRPNAGREARPAHAERVSAAVTGPQLPKPARRRSGAGAVGSFLGVRRRGHARSCSASPSSSRARRSRSSSRTTSSTASARSSRCRSAEAASWDPAAVERAARVAAAEAARRRTALDVRADGGHRARPAVGAHRRGLGRGSRTSARRWRRRACAASRAPTLRRPRLRDHAVATAKHFVAYGAAEGGRDYNVADVSARTLREIYLPPFHAAANAGARSVMASFNEVDGVPMHANACSIDGVLRARVGLGRDSRQRLYGRDGAAQPRRRGRQRGGRRARDQCRRRHGHGERRSTSSSSPARCAPDACRSRWSTAPCAACCARSTERGLFEDPYRYSSVARERALTLAPAFVAEARDMARRSIVLLKNDGGVLPAAEGPARPGRDRTARR